MASVLTFVLDDGWFGHRDDDTTSLGDWFVNRQLPNGFAPLIEQCEAQGMSFGIWIEPEMVSEDSELFRPSGLGHPPPGTPLLRGRNQLVLDLSRKEVAESCGGCISALLQENRIFLY